MSFLPISESQIDIQKIEIKDEKKTYWLGRCVKSRLKCLCRSLSDCVKRVYDFIIGIFRKNEQEIMRIQPSVSFNSFSHNKEEEKVIPRPPSPSSPPTPLENYEKADSPEQSPTITPNKSPYISPYSEGEDGFFKV